ncbi:hypothetical protein ACP4OV_004947 [Aristida adscensionis]
MVCLRKQYPCLTPKTACFEKNRHIIFFEQRVMAEIVGSAVATEAVSRISSFLLGERPSHESVHDKAERLELAVLKIHSVVAVSEDTHVSHLPLLQWKAKLKRVAKEGDELLHAHKKQILQCNNGASSSSSSSSSISQFLIHAAKRCVPFRRNKSDDELDDATLRRFERLADGADSFFRLVESGGGPKGPILRSSFARSLLAGESTEFSLRSGSSRDLILLWPWPDHTHARNGLEACLLVSREDEVLWQRNFKMAILFRLSEAADLLDLAVSCLELLPPQFGAARASIMGVLTETIGENCSNSKLSALSLWCCEHMQRKHHSDCEPSMANGRRISGLLLPPPVIRFGTYCYVSPATDKLPHELVCHVSPYLLPEKHSSQYVQVEHNVITELLPKVTDGLIDNHHRQAHEYKMQMWCPKSSMYCSVAAAISQPLTFSKAYLMESSTGPNKRRRRIARTKSHTVSGSQNIARPQDLAISDCYV